MDRAVSTVEGIKQAMEERKLIATSQGFLETSCFSSYWEARKFLLHISLPAAEEERSHLSPVAARSPGAGGPGQSLQVVFREPRHPVLTALLELVFLQPSLLLPS